MFRSGLVLGGQVRPQPPLPAGIPPVVVAVLAKAADSTDRGGGTAG